MSSGKLKSLKLQRTSQRNESAANVQAQDPSTSVVDEGSAWLEANEKSSEQPESLTPLHSTPKRSSGRSNATQDHAALGYRVSPILLPCTQEGVNEVAWDWESPLTKKAKRKCLNNVESAGTPKRASALQKKRSSNSPLLYKPIKRQLMKNDPQQESLKKFAAEMKALSEQIKVMPREAENSAARVDKEETDDELLIQIDSGDFEGETKFEFTTNNENSNGSDVVVLKTSMDDFFDDSIDDSMVRCSQEVEEKLKLVSSRGGQISNCDSTNSSGAKDSSWHQQNYSRLLAAKDRSGEAAGTSSKFGTGASSASSSKFGAGASSSSSSKLGGGANSASSSKFGSGANSASYSKVGSGANSASSSSAQRVGTATSEAKRSSASIKITGSTTTSASAGSKFNAAPEKKTSSFSLKVPTKEAKTSTFPVKFPTSEVRRPNTSSIPSAPSRSSSFNNNAKETSKQSSAIVSSLDEVFEIPDDSFDDFLAVCFDDEDVQSTTEAASSRNEGDRSSSRHGKTYEARSATRTSFGSLRGSDGATARKLPLQPPQQPPSSGNILSRGNSAVPRTSASALFPRSVSNDSLKPSARGASSAAAPPSQSTSAAAPPSQSTATNQARKFFKKSLSSSSFDDQGSSSAKGWKSNLFVNGKVSSVSTQERGIHRADDSRNNAWPSANGSECNAGMYNVNRNGPRDDDNVRYKQANGSSRQGGRETAAGSQSAQICTPEEIERKRLEAKMKLEAKRKLTGRSASSGALSGVTKLPIKR